MGELRCDGEVHVSVLTDPSAHVLELLLTGGGEVTGPRRAVDEGQCVVAGDVARGLLIVVALGKDVPGGASLASLGGDLGAELVGGDAMAGAQLVDDAGLCPCRLGLLVAPCHGGLVGLRDPLGAAPSHQSARWTPARSARTARCSAARRDCSSRASRSLLAWARRRASSRMRARRSPACAAAVTKSRV
ncbi:hypothetical protein CIK67_17635 [Brachybacterium alimentarium]|nr:hypothetical protein CIK67_17635 [Brachybacterium alimentarium]